MMPKFRIVKEKEQRKDTLKRRQQNVYFFFSIKTYVKKSDIEYLKVPGSKICYKLIERMHATKSRFRVDEFD